MKTTWLTIGKVLLSGVLAFCALTLFSVLYANTPAHHADPDGATDYRWDPDTFYSQAREGYSFGRTNNEGYYCLRDYHEGDRVDILVMGSSHMEASNVQPEQSTASRLDAMLEDKVVYNIGTSAHTFLVCADNLANAVTKYRPRDFVVMELEQLSFTKEELAPVLDGTLEDIPSLNGGVFSLLQKNQYLRLLYRQLQNHMGGKADGFRLPAFLTRLRSADAPENPAGSMTAETALPDEVPDDRSEEQMLRELLVKLRTEAAESGAQLVIFFHPSTTVYDDGSLHLEYYDDETAWFGTLCEESGILFLNMSDRFTAEYEARFVLPYGFPDTAVCTGHLNKNGHEMIAEELYKLITEED